MNILFLYVAVFAFSGAQSATTPECASITTEVDEPCCKMGCPHKMFGLGKAIKECAEELKVEPMKFMAGVDTTGGCFDECILTKVKFLTKDKALDAAALKEAFTKEFTGSWSDVATKVLDECVKSATSSDASDAKCKSGSNKFMLCITRNLFLNCPKDKWTENGECKTIKETLEKCPDSYPPPPKKKD